MAAAIDLDGLIAADWPAPPNIHAYASTRRLAGASVAPFDRCNLGLNTFDDGERVRANRDCLAARLGLAEIAFLKQVHGTAVVSAPNAEATADAAISRQPMQACAVLSADCLPVLLCARDGSEVAAIHAGWHGLCAGVIEACVRSCQSQPDQLIAWLGPAIGPRAFEVGEEVRAQFVALDQAAEQAFVRSAAGRWLADLYALARLRLAGVGVSAVYGGGFCTFSDPANFYSWRRDGQASGRQATLIWRST